MSLTVKNWTESQFLDRIDFVKNLCKDGKEDIEATYWQVLCFEWGNSEENISAKEKVSRFRGEYLGKGKSKPPLTTGSTNNVPTIAKYFLQ